MLERLHRIVDEISHRNTRLLLLVGQSCWSEAELVGALGARYDIAVVNVGLQLSRRLAAVPHDDRGFVVGEILREVAGRAREQDLLLVKNLEVLFEKSLGINPLALLKRLAHSTRVVALWPGELRGDRLVYANRNHPEHRDYSRDGVVVFELAKR